MQALASGVGVSGFPVGCSLPECKAASLLKVALKTMRLFRVRAKA